MRSSAQRINFQPRSLQQNSLYVTSSSRATMLKSGRGVAAAKVRTTTPTKVRSFIPNCLYCVEDAVLPRRLDSVVCRCLAVHMVCQGKTVC